MTTLPSRNTLTAIGQTYGQVRTAIGDLRDFLFEALGGSGTTPQIANATILSAQSVGIRTATPGADVQIAGSLAVTTGAAAATDPNDGNAFIEGKLGFSSASGVKVEFPAASGNALAIGRQPDILYFRTKSAGGFAFYEGGTHSDTAYAPGTGGTELLRCSGSTFQYKGQTIYHSGNGVFIRKDAADTAAEKITFAKGLDVSGQDIAITNSSSRLRFTATATGNKIQLHSDASFQIGIQPASLFIRTFDKFAIYKGGSFTDLDAPAPGTNGETLFYLDGSSIQYKGQTVYHAGNSNFVTRHSTNSPGVIRLYEENDAGAYMQIRHNHFGDSRYGLVIYPPSGGVSDEVRVRVSSFAYWDGDNGRRLLSAESSTRPGVVRLYTTTDNGHHLYLFDDGSKIWLDGSNSRQIWARNATYADTAGSANYMNGANLGDGTVGVAKLSKGSGNSVNGSYFGVQQYTFGAPYVDLNCREAWVSPGYANGCGQHRVWRAYYNAGGTIVALSNSDTKLIAWDYLTGSGNPFVWVTYDDMDNIQTVWEAEDPVDPEDPEFCPILEPNNRPNPRAVLVRIPPLKTIEPLLEKATRDIPQWARQTKKFTQIKTPQELLKTMMHQYTSERSLMPTFTEEMNIHGFIEDFGGDDQKKAWRRQAVLRKISPMVLGEEHLTFGHLLKQAYKVNRRTGVVELK